MPERQMVRILTQQEDDPTETEDRISRILRAVRSHLGMDVAFIAEFRDEDRVFRFVEHEGKDSPIAKDDVMPLDEGYCRAVVEGRLPELIPDTSRLPAALALPATAALPIGAHLSVPIRLSDGQVFGTFCCFSHAADPTLRERDLLMMRAFSDLAADYIQHDIDARRTREERFKRISAIIKEDRLSLVYQPIIRLSDDRITGFECLARFSAEPKRPPNLWFDEAEKAGLAVELELAVIGHAREALRLVPPPAYLGINLSPKTILSGRLPSVLHNIPGERILLEVTEHAEVDDYAELARALEPLRHRGVRLAVDDTGAGFSSMRHILNLRPELIKLDMSLIRDLDSDRARRALVAALVAFGQTFESQIVAEGVQTAAELDTLRMLGVHKAQGFLLSRPLTVEDAKAAWKAKGTLTAGARRRGRQSA